MEITNCGCDFILMNGSTRSDLLSYELCLMGKIFPLQIHQSTLCLDLHHLHFVMIHSSYICEPETVERSWNSSLVCQVPQWVIREVEFDFFPLFLFSPLVNRMPIEQLKVRFFLLFFLLDSLANANIIRVRVRKYFSFHI